jgi:hypothetical protein
MKLEFEIIEGLKAKAIAKFEAGNYNSAEGFGWSARQAFGSEGLESAVWRTKWTLGITCDLLLEAREWSEAKSILLELIGAGDVRCDEDSRLAHTLAEVYMAEGDLHKAVDYCFRAAKGRRSAFGKGHALFLESVTLLVKIYKAKGDGFEAQGYEGTYLIVPYQKPEYLLKSRTIMHPSICKSFFTRVLYCISHRKRGEQLDRKKGKQFNG